MAQAARIITFYPAEGSLSASLVAPRVSGDVPSGFPADALFEDEHVWVAGGGRHGYGLRTPAAHDKEHAGDADEQDDGRHPPGEAVEAGEHGGGERDGAVLILRGAKDAGVIVALVDGRHELGAHLGRGGAIHVVALAEQLVAAAGTHDLVAELVVTRAVGGVRRVGTEDDKRGEEQKGKRMANPHCAFCWLEHSADPSTGLRFGRDDEMGMTHQSP